MEGPDAAARAARLRYVTLDDACITRVRAPERFRYVDHAGDEVNDDITLARIRSLVIPPAWEDVRICRWPDGHLQAAGRDVRGRRQYRYHPRWREIRDEGKYHRLLVFGRALPTIRERADADLARSGLPRKKVLAAVVRLLETTLMRVGNAEYAKSNKSFGLTTLRNRHVRVKGERLVFDFRGKSGVHHHIDLRDRRLARLVKQLQDLPGQALFLYLDEAGEQRGVGSDDVNAYLREISDEDVTAKDFRTWAGTILAVRELRELEPFTSQTGAKRNVTRAVEAVAALLGNTPSICRKCYIHPAIIDAYLGGTLPRRLIRRTGEALAGPAEGLLRQDEAAVMRFLKARLKAGD